MVQHRKIVGQRRHHRSHRPRQDDADAAILRVQAEKGLGQVQDRTKHIAKGGIVRDKNKTVTVIASHVKYETDIAQLRPHRLSRSRRLHQEHDYRRGPDGRRGAVGVGR